MIIINPIIAAVKGKNITVPGALENNKISLFFSLDTGNEAAKIKHKA